MKTYEVGVNNLYYSENDDCDYCDKQYVVKVKGKGETQAKEKAKERVKELYKGLLVGERLEVAWINVKED